MHTLIALYIHCDRTRCLNDIKKKKEWTSASQISSHLTYYIHRTSALARRSVYYNNPRSEYTAADFNVIKKGVLLQ